MRIDSSISVLLKSLKKDRTIDLHTKNIRMLQE